MSNQAFTASELKSSFEEYLAGGSAYLISNRLRVNTAQFLRWVDEFSSSGEVDTQKISQKGFPVMAEKLHAALSKPDFIEVKEEEPKMELEPEKPKRARKVLTQDEKKDLYNFVRSGATKTEAAELFSVSIATVSNIMNSPKETKNTGVNVAIPNTDGVYTTQGVSSIAKMYGANEVAVTIEGDFVVVRFPKNKITRELLKGVL